MTSHIRTNLYHLILTDVDYNVAHLYEHLLIASFKQHVAKNNFPKHLFGWLSGETFRDVMFLDYGFYSEKVEKLFKQFINNEHRVDYSLLDTELSRIQSESQSVLQPYDKKSLLRQLKKLDKKQFADHETPFAPVAFERPDTAHQSSILILKPSRKDFRSITVTYGATNLTLEQKLVLLRLRPLILDAIDDVLFQAGGYQNDTSQTYDFEEAHHTLAVTALFTIARGKTNIREIKTAIQTQLGELAHEINSYPEGVSKYFNSFETTPGWHAFAIEFYRHSGVLASRKAISATSTQGAIQSLLKKIELAVHETSSASRRVVRQTDTSMLS